MLDSITRSQSCKAFRTGTDTLRFKKSQETNTRTKLSKSGIIPGAPCLALIDRFQTSTVEIYMDYSLDEKKTIKRYRWRFFLLGSCQVFQTFFGVSHFSISVISIHHKKL